MSKLLTPNLQILVKKTSPCGDILSERDKDIMGKDRKRKEPGRKTLRE